MEIGLNGQRVMCGGIIAGMSRCSFFYSGSDAIFSFNFKFNAVKRWRYFDWMCLGGLLIRCRYFS